jgi:hypothetical protein
MSLAPPPSASAVRPLPVFARSNPDLLDLPLYSLDIPLYSLDKFLYSLYLLLYSLDLLLYSLDPLLYSLDPPTHNGLRPFHQTSISLHVIRRGRAETAGRAKTAAVIMSSSRTLSRGSVSRAVCGANLVTLPPDSGRFAAREYIVEREYVSGASAIGFHSVHLLPYFSLLLSSLELSDTKVYEP